MHDRIKQVDGASSGSVHVGGWYRESGKAASGLRSTIVHLFPPSTIANGARKPQIFFNKVNIHSRRRRHDDRKLQEDGERD